MIKLDHIESIKNNQLKIHEGKRKLLLIRATFLYIFFLYIYCIDTFFLYC